MLCISCIHILIEIIRHCWRSSDVIWCKIDKALKKNSCTLKVQYSILEPGSHMLPMHLWHSRRYFLGYCSDMRTEVAGNFGHPSLYCSHACLVDSSSTSQACRGKALQWLQLPVADVLIHLRSSPGGTGGFVTNTRYISGMWESPITVS